MQEGLTSSEEPLSQFIRLVVQGMVQEALEQEVTDYLGRERYERQTEPKGYCNGYKLGRVRTRYSAVLPSATACRLFAG